MLIPIFSVGLFESGADPARAEPDRVPQHLGPHGRVRAGRRRHAPASSTTSRGRRSSCCSRRRSSRRRRRRRERPLRAPRRLRPSGSLLAAARPRRRELPRVAPLEAVRLDADPDLLPLGDDEEDPRRAEEAGPGDGVHDAALAAVCPRSRSSCRATRRAVPKIEVEYLDPERNPARAEALVRESGARSTRSCSAPATARSTSRKTSSPTSTTRARAWAAAPSVKAFKGEEAFTSAILSVTESRQPQVVLLEGARRGVARLGRARPRLRRGQAAARARQHDGRRRGTRSARTSCPRTPTSSWSPGPRTAFLEPEAERPREVPGRREDAPSSCSTRSCRGRARRRPTSGSEGLLGKYGIKLGDDLVVDPANALPMVGRGDRAGEPLRQPPDRRGRSRPKACR